MSNVERMPWPVETIEGVFLDALQPVSEEPRSLHKNLNIGDMPLTIAGNRYLRGLGTHADSRIVYSLGGKFRRFQSWVGVDITADVATTFSVRVDGEKRWESGLMSHADAAAFVDIDVAGAQTLELIAASGTPRRGYGGGLVAQPDKANWAEARLLR